VKGALRSEEGGKKGLQNPHSPAGKDEMKRNLKEGQIASPPVEEFGRGGYDIAIRPGAREKLFTWKNGITASLNLSDCGKVRKKTVREKKKTHIRGKGGVLQGKKCREKRRTLRGDFFARTL